MSRNYAEMQLELMRQQAIQNPFNFIHLFDDFVVVPVDDTTGIVTGWAKAGDAGATAVTGPADGKGGWLQVTCDGDDNDEYYLSSGSEAFIFNTTDEVIFETRVKHTAGSTDGKSSFIVGLSDTVGANSIVDAGTTMASFDGAVFTKEEDGNVAFVTSNAATQTRTAAAFTWADGSTVRLGFHYNPADGVTGVITPLVNGVAGTPHEITISGLAEMHVLMGVKTHEAAEQALLVDYVQAVQPFSGRV